MARKKQNAGGTKSSNGANLGFEAKLWAAADALRNNMDAAEYKHVVLGLIFLKYISDAFEAKHAELEAQKKQGADPEDPDEYRAASIFWVPKEARWQHLKASAPQPTIGTIVDDAMTAIERDNPLLKGVLPKDFGRAGLDKQRLGQLINLVSDIALGSAADRAKDTLGRVYEYFLARFASAEGKSGGQFYTPSCVVRVLVEMLTPYKGRVYDPACGSGGMFVQSEKFIEAHGGSIGDISIYGQESNYTTWRLAKMNLAIRGIDAQIAHGDTFHNDKHPDLKADYVLANPPFNDSDWRGELLKNDKRWVYGAPPAGNANYAWVQHFIHHLAPTGVAGFILGNMALTSETGNEDVIRKGIVDANLVDCIVMLPDKLFYSTPIPVSAWIIRRSRATSLDNQKRPRDILFIDASKLGRAVSRTHRELTDEDITEIARTYHAWRNQEECYTDRVGFCRTVPVNIIAENRYNLLPAAYVGLGHTKIGANLQLQGLLDGPQVKIASQALSGVAEIQRLFDEAIGHVKSEAKNLEHQLTLKTYTLGELLEESDDRLGNAEEPEVLTCTESGGLILQRERFAKRVATADASKYKIVRKGDIVYNPYLLWKGSIDQCWIVDVGITSPAYEVLRVRPGFDKTLVGQMVTSPEMITRYDGISFGTIQRRRRAPVERFLELKVNLPSPEHFSAISDLLSCAQDSQFACRNAERAIRQLIKDVCGRFR